MRAAKKRFGFFFTGASIITCLSFPINGFSADKSAGFYAGPLSAVATAVVETSEDTPQKKNAAVQKSPEAEKAAQERSSEFNEGNPLSRPS